MKSGGISTLTLLILFQIKSQKAGTMSFFLKFPHTSSTTVQSGCMCMIFYNKKTINIYSMVIAILI